MADIKINGLDLALSISDNMQLETDIGGTVANKINIVQLKDTIAASSQMVEKIQDTIGTSITGSGLNVTYDDTSGITSIVATPTTIGLGSVDNTSDANKPISTDTQTALNAKQDTLTLTTTGTSGAATLTGATLNIPQYSGGGSGLVGIQNIFNYFPSAAFGIDASLNATGLTNTGVSANSIIAYPFTPNKTITSSQLKINVTLLGVGLSRILIYSNNNGFPNSKLYESTDINVSTTAVKTITTTQTFTAGTTYWLAYHTNIAHSITGIAGGALTPLFLSNVANTPVTFYTLPATFGSAPSTFTYSGGNSGAVPKIMIIP